MDRDEQQLISDFLAGDQSAFDVLVERYIKPVYVFVFRLVGSSSDAQDLSQDVFLKAWKSFRSFKTSMSFKAWLFGIARNASIDFLRKKKSPVFSDFDTEDGNFLTDGLSDPAPLPDELFDRASLAGDLAVAMEKLSLSQKEVIYLRYNDHFSLPEIAETLNVPLDTVKTRHRRALLQLRRLLGAG